MKNKVFTIANNIICSLGNTTQDVFEKVLNEKSGVQNHPDLGEVPMSRIDRQGISNQFQQLETQVSDVTFFEQLLILSIQDAISKTDLNIKGQDVICIISTTKGNIELLQNGSDSNIERSYLTSSAQVVKNHFNFTHIPIIVSNACVSGVVAINQAVRLLNNNKYKHAIVVGADTLSDFIISGFLSFKSLCETICKPFDKNRTGLNLGEGAGTMILSTKANDTAINIEVLGGASANDANHISGPSRTGEGLYQAVKKTTDVVPDYISAHGTATPYNDDMESKAIARAGYSDVPVNSFKGYFGHTLGAAGIIESILGVESIKSQKLVKTMGYDTFGVAEPINVIDKTQTKPIKNFLKLGSGFGGSNAACFFKIDE